MKKQYSFKNAAINEELTILKKQWLSSLTSPQDEMWASFRDNATHIEIRTADKVIGYACIRHKNRLLQFYVSPEYMSQGTEIFEQFIAALNIDCGIVGTNNPIFLSVALHFFKKLDIHFYLFRENFEVAIDKKEGNLKKCLAEDLETIVDFCHYSTGKSKAWLEEYCGKLIKKGEIFSFENAGKTIGTCEVRRNPTSPSFADIGMLVSPDFRRKGYGTYLLHQAKSIAIEWGKTPICSCEKDNIGSIKSIQNCGFISKSQLLLMTFKK